MQQRSSEHVLTSAGKRYLERIKRVKNKIAIKLIYLTLKVYIAILIIRSNK
jgi:hypothetical protein